MQTELIYGVNDWFCDDKNTRIFTEFLTKVGARLYIGLSLWQVEL